MRETASSAMYIIMRLLDETAIIIVTATAISRK